MALENGVTDTSSVTPTSSFSSGGSPTDASSSSWNEPDSDYYGGKDHFWTDLFDAFGIGTAGRQSKFNADQAKIQRQWEEYMSNTAVRRKMADLKAAGINPLMAGMGSASGASTPSGASANMSEPKSSGALMKALGLLGLVLALI